MSQVTADHAVRRAASIVSGPIRSRGRNFSSAAEPGRAVRIPGPRLKPGSGDGRQPANEHQAEPPPRGARGRRPVGLRRTIAPAGRSCRGPRGHVAQQDHLGPRHLHPPAPPLGAARRPLADLRSPATPRAPAAWAMRGVSSVEPSSATHTAAPGNARARPSSGAARRSASLWAVTIRTRSAKGFD